MTTITTMQIGWAHLTASTQAFLDRCEAVQSWTTDDSDRYAIFQFAPMVEVWYTPNGVFFDLDDAPAEVIEIAEKLN